MNGYIVVNWRERIIDSRVFEDEDKAKSAAFDALTMSDRGTIKIEDIEVVPVEQQRIDN